MADTTFIRDNLSRVRSEVRRLEKLHNRPTGSVSILAVSKTKPADLVRAASDADQLSFGENYVEEGIEKRQSIGNEQLDWHYIGAIQSNKTRLLATHYNWVQSVDRAKIATRLAEQRPTGLPPLNVCIQINIDDEPSKSGCAPDAAAALAALIQTHERLTLRGVMAIPAPSAHIDEQRKSCAALASIYQQLQIDHPGMDTLSVGMSSDMEAAIAEGSTMVRIGTAIFGPRDYPKSN